MVGMTLRSEGRHAPLLQPESLTTLLSVGQVGHREACGRPQQSARAGDTWVERDS